MLSDAQAFWDSIKSKIDSEIKRLTQNAVRRERYDVAEIPDGNLIGVKLPFGNNILHIPYSSAIADARVGDAVLVEWRGSLSTALAISYGDGPKDGGGSFELERMQPTVLGGAYAKNATPQMTGYVGIDSDGFLRLSEGNSSMERLWVNASPTSPMAQFTINKDLSKYQALLINYYHATTLDGAGSVCMVKVDGRKSYMWSLYQIFGRRTIQATQSSIQISVGEASYDQGGPFTANNNVCIPYEILGMGVK